MVKSTTTPFTREIRDRIGSAGISLREFLRRAGLPTSALYRWETGHKPKPSTVDLVRETLATMEMDQHGPQA